MSLLSKLANKEIVNFLRSTTLKNCYFADKYEKESIRSNYLELMPAIETPYVKHVAGEYILQSIPTDHDENGRPLGYIEVTSPMTGEKVQQVYSASSLILDRKGERTQLIKNAALYNPDTFDEMMYVTSLDTGETIPFTLENLHSEFAVAAGYDADSVHTKTLTAYKLPSRYYDLLCQRYPNQTDLIKAIVYPVAARDYTEDELANYEQAGVPLPTLSERRRMRIAEAKNFEPLAYDDTLLEDNERSSIVSQFKATIDSICRRWDVKEYTFEENYAAAQWATIWSILPLALMAQRYANVKTPFVHSLNIWDYLTSKGLEEYKGYITTDQAVWLYKNIDYLDRHRGKQMVTNLLIDELLTEFNLNIEAKTVVLDTSKTLLADEVATYPQTQCASCSRHRTCKKHITTYLCPTFLGLEYACKPTPIILTEEFSGASRSKILNVLVNHYGYSEEEARIKYDRSFIWRDEEIDEIRDDLNRTQLVDLNGATESYRDLFQREHLSLLEPLNDTDEAERQEQSLRHIAGTYAPTKLLEMNEQTFNVRYTDLFNLFFTETLFRMAPYTSTDGLIHKRVNDSYKFAIKNSTNTYILGFDEMLAVLYLGTVKERILEFTRTKGLNADKTVIPNDIFTNFMGADLSPEVIKALATENGDTFNFPIPNRAKVSFAFKYGKPVKQEDLIKAYETSPSFHPFLSMVTNRVNTTKIVDIGDTQYAVAFSQYCPGGVAEDPYIWVDADWKESDGNKFVNYSALTILGQFAEGTYIENHNEIPIIPTYFRWFGEHLGIGRLRTDDKTVVEGKKYYFINKQGEFEEVDLSKYELSYEEKCFKMIANICYESTCTQTLNPSEMGWYEDAEIVEETEETKILEEEDKEIVIEGVKIKVKHDGHLTEDPIILKDRQKSDTVHKKYSPSKTKSYQKCRLDKVIDIDVIINEYIDIMYTVGRQVHVGKYLTTMFGLLERILMIASATADSRIHFGIVALLHTLFAKKFIDFELTNAQKKSYFKSIEDKNGKRVAVATYKDWLDDNEDLSSAISNIVGSSDSEYMWNEFNTVVIEKLLDGCTLSYATTSVNKNKFNKLKQLVRNLSSYRVAFIETTEQKSVANELTQIVRGYADDASRGESEFAFGTITDGDGTNTLRNYTVDNGWIYVPTEDQYVVSGKNYYVLSNSTSMKKMENPLVVEDEITDGGSTKTVTRNITGVESGKMSIDFVLVDTTSKDATYHPQRGEEPASLIPFGTFYERISIYEILPTPTAYRSDTNLELTHDSSTKYEVVNGVSKTVPKWSCRTGLIVNAVICRPGNATDYDFITDDPFLGFSYCTPELKELLRTDVYKKNIIVKATDWGQSKKDKSKDPENPRGNLSVFLDSTVATDMSYTHVSHYNMDWDVNSIAEEM